ncbi:hypothetical protein [Ruegeria halocynthiae]|uniref:hypothetical protein n=1 Tax=Ruegeria halocynthiae TaxID=985054 RepID=UPI00055EBEF6|nr:hypothetical protein [Ruegeria halocynthiae]
MTKIKAIAYGLGTVGIDVIAPAVDKGIEFVGAIDINPDLVGRDLGEAAGLGKDLGVKISADAAEVLANNPADVVFLSLFNDVRQMQPFIEDCVRAGLNVITPADDAVYPWAHAPEVSAAIDELAKSKGVSVIGSGLSDALVVSLVASLAGACHNLSKVKTDTRSCLNHASAYDLQKFGVGHDPEIVRAMFADFDELPAKRTTFEAIAADMGLKVTDFGGGYWPVVAEKDFYVPEHDLHVKAGTTMGIGSDATLETEEGISFEGVIRFELYPEGEADAGHSKMTLSGTPDISVVMSDIDVHGHVCYQIVNRVPDAIKAAPGLITNDELPRPKYRAFALDSYLS